ncbi:vacuolar ATP synthase subunit C, putative [Pediculus humanus corporis]|uniref:V-type proton ATPase subunit C n=1 Tax=Pediculus humanus subsp. corporis TaxID=121224 RepID=E0VAJ3_PEDHC|nr:vacuolar ATP synthase subunit C, putative [Pediculus humanus corporis]EEB10399.1 vacuolar ATP synthase subunit C, putative [Pediculus humanus corporis]
MTEYWLISAPGEKTCQQTWETMNNLTNKQNNLSVNYKFHIPDLKVGTLDQLVGLSDDLGKLDSFVDSITRKVAAYLGEVLEDQRDKLHENLMANNNSYHILNTSIEKTGKINQSGNSSHFKGRIIKCEMNFIKIIHFSLLSYMSQPDPSKYNGFLNLCSKYFPKDGMPPILCYLYNSVDAIFRRKAFFKEYYGLALGNLARTHFLKIVICQVIITRFQWDMAKYPIKQSLRNIADIISKQIGQIDSDLKTKSNAYNQLKSHLQNMEKKQTLLTRNLADLVKKEHFILDSEYLTTLLVIVPRNNFPDWQGHYEKLTDMIVPRSSQLITQDNDYGLFTVTLFKKVVEEFKLHAREKKFVVREFTYNEEEMAAGKNEITKLVLDKKKQFGPLVRWLKVNFSECFCAWIHVKALRVFVESVLRYGLPVNFQAMLLQPNKKNTKRLREILNQLYGHLDSSALQGSGHQDSVDIPGLGFGQADYFPYVYYKINIDMVDSKA